MDEPTAPTLNIRLLGEFSLDHEGAPLTGVSTPRLQSLLAYLLLFPAACEFVYHLVSHLEGDSLD